MPDRSRDLLPELHTADKRHEYAHQCPALSKLWWHCLPPGLHYLPFACFLLWGSLSCLLFEPAHLLFGGAALHGGHDCVLEAVLPIPPHLPPKRCA